MVKKFLVLLFLVKVVLGFDNSLLLIESKLFPKILYLINKNPNNLKYSILYNDETFQIALKMKNMLSKYNVKLIKKYDLKYDVTIITYRLSPNELEELVKNRKIIFSIFPKFIDSAMFSVYLDTRVKPFVNIYLIKKAKIPLNPILLKVGKLYEK